MGEVLAYGRTPRAWRRKLGRLALLALLVGGLLYTLPTLYTNARVMLLERRIAAAFAADAPPTVIYDGASTWPGFVYEPLLVDSRLELHPAGDVLYVTTLRRGDVRRRVAVHVACVFDDADDLDRPSWVRVTPASYLPATPWHVRPTPEHVKRFMLDARPHGRLSLAPPRHDPADPSRLTLPFVTPAGEVRIDVYLQPSGGFVVEPAR